MTISDRISVPEDSTAEGYKLVVNQGASGEWYSGDKYTVSTVFDNRITVQRPEF